MAKTKENTQEKAKDTDSKDEKPFDLMEVSARDYYTRHKGCLK